MKINDDERKKRGKAAEDYVCKFLLKNGYGILDRNVSIHGFGELDIVANRNNEIYIIEVKARQQCSNYGGPLAAISSQKIRRVMNSSNCYLKMKGLMNNYVSILAAGVSLNKSGEIVSIEIVPVERL